MNEDGMFSTFPSLLYTPVVGDVRDSLRRHHRFLPRAVQPMRESMKVVGLAAMLARNQGHIPFIASMAPLPGVPQVAAYSAAGKLITGVCLPVDGGASIGF